MKKHPFQTIIILPVKNMFFISVILTNATFTREYISGKLVVTKHSRQYDVCYDMSFIFKMAELACSELGYRYAAILKPAVTDDLSRYYMMKNFYCTESAKSLAQCQTSVGYCSYGHVRLLCYQNPLNGKIIHFHIVSLTNNYWKCS